MQLAAARDREAALLDFDKLDIVAGLQSKVFAHVRGKGDAAVEGDHCGMHTEHLNSLYPKAGGGRLRKTKAGR